MKKSLCGISEDNPYDEALVLSEKKSLNMCKKFIICEVCARTMTFKTNREMQHG